MEGPSACIALAVAFVAGLWLCSQVFGGSSADAPVPEEVYELLGQAEAAIRRSYDYKLALRHVQAAFDLAPQSAGVRQFYGSVLLALGHVTEAWQHFRVVFESRAAESEDTHFLQQYVLSLHRLGKADELAAAWPRILALPGVQWRSPLQCPDQVDESLLGGAVPFPRAEGSRFVQLLVERREAINLEFQAFSNREGWDSSRYFKSNQDNDLVQGNEPRRWTEMLFFEKGQWAADHCKIFPTVCRTLRGLVEVEGILHGKRSGQVSLLKLEAGSTLVPHFGSVNWRYTAHLGLLVPDDVFLQAGGETRRFEQGELLILDDSFLHSVEHNGTSPRVTLFANFFHPEAHPMTYDEWLSQGG